VLAINSLSDKLYYADNFLDFPLLFLMVQHGAFFYDGTTHWHGILISNDSDTSDEYCKFTTQEK
jgi:hypothetical protein